MSEQPVYQMLPSSFQSALPFPRGYQSTDKGFSEWQLDPKDVLELIEHALRGEFWDTELKQWITASHQNTEIKPIEQMDGSGKKIIVQVKVPSGIPSDKSRKVKPLLNEDGILDILRDISNRVNRVIIMSNWDEREMNDWLWDLDHNLSAKIFFNVLKWEIGDVYTITYKDNGETVTYVNPDLIRMQTLHDTVMFVTDAAIHRAFKEGERRRIYEATKTTEQIITERENQKKGFFSGIPILGGLSR